MTTDVDFTAVWLELIELVDGSFDDPSGLQATRAAVRNQVALGPPHVSNLLNFLVIVDEVLKGSSTDPDRYELAKGVRMNSAATVEDVDLCDDPEALGNLFAHVLSECGPGLQENDPSALEEFNGFLRAMGETDQRVPDVAVHTIESIVVLQGAAVHHGLVDLSGIRDPS